MARAQGGVRGETSRGWGRDVACCIMLALRLVVVALCAAIFAGCERSAVTATPPASPGASASTQAVGAATQSSGGAIEKLVLPDAEWRKRLTPEQYKILREHGTERAFTGPYHDHKGREGTFVCAGCELALFDAATKFDSGTGWPSYWQPIAKANVIEVEDRSYGMVRTEVRCGRCDGHLGHVFPDGPAPTGLRYCINGHALKLVGK